MRGIQVELPESATARLAELQIRRDNALTMSRTAQAALNALPDDAASALRDRLVSERDKHVQAHNYYHRLQSAVQQWLFQLRLRPGEVLREAPVAAELRKGETPAEAIGRLRVEMLRIAQELAKTRSASLPVADQIAAAEEFISRKSLVGKPKVSIVRDQMQLSWADDVLTCKTDLLTLLAWIAPKSLLDAIKREINEGPPPANSRSAAVRIKKVQLRVADEQPHIAADVGLGEARLRDVMGKDAAVIRERDRKLDKVATPRKPRVARAKVSATRPDGSIPVTLGGKLPPRSVLSRRAYGLRALRP